LTTIHTVRVLNYHIWLQLWLSHSCRPTIYVQLTAIMVWHIPLEIRLITGEHTGEKVFVPWMGLQPIKGQLPFNLSQLHIPLNSAFPCPSTNLKGSWFGMWDWIAGVQCLHMASSMWQYRGFSLSTTSKLFGQAQVRWLKQKILYIMT
jgi:hypothetical protein